MEGTLIKMAMLPPMAMALMTRAKEVNIPTKVATSMQSVLSLLLDRALYESNQRARGAPGKQNRMDLAFVWNFNEIRE
jgi:hypothetical protein